MTLTCFQRIVGASLVVHVVPVGCRRMLMLHDLDVVTVVDVIVAGDC